MIEMRKFFELNYRFEKDERTEEFKRSAQDFMELKLKEFGITKYTLTMGECTEDVNTINCILFTVKSSDELQFAVVKHTSISDSDSWYELLVVLTCEKCGEQSWESIDSKYELGMYLSTHVCRSLAQRIADQKAVESYENIMEDEIEDTLDKIMECSEDCEICGNKCNRPKNEDERE